MKLFVQGGDVRFVYSDRAMEALSCLGPAIVRRASHVEPDLVGWVADMGPVGGQSAAFRRRADALAWEVEQLELMGAPLPKETK